MKIKTNKIKMLGTGVLLANVMTGLFAAPLGVGVSEKFSGEDYTSIGEITLSNGMDSQKTFFPKIELVGGQLKDSFTLTEVSDMTQLGQDTVVQDLEQLSVTGGQTYENFEFDKTLRLSGGVNQQFSNLVYSSIEKGQDEEKVNINGGNNIILDGGFEGEFASSEVASSVFPDDLNWKDEFSLKDSNGELIKFYPQDSTRTLNEMVAELESLNLPDYPFEIKKTPGFTLHAKAKTVGSDQDKDYLFIFEYTNSENEPQTFNLDFSLSGGQDPVKASTQVEITHDLAHGGPDDTIDLGLANRIDLSDSDKSFKSKLEIAQKIKSELEDDSAYDDKLNIEIIQENENVFLNLESNYDNPYSDVTIEVGYSDNGYTIQTPLPEIFSIDFTENLIENAQDSKIEILGKEIDFGNLELTSDELVNEILENNFNKFVTSLNNDGSALFTANIENFGDFGDDFEPIDNSDLSTQNGMMASGSFEISKPVSDAAIELEIEVLGQAIRLAQGDSIQEIAQKIETAFETSDDYLVSAVPVEDSENFQINIQAKNYGEEFNIQIFGEKNSYSTIDSELGESEPVYIPNGIQMGSTNNQVTINSKTITFDTSSDLSAEQVRDQIISQYNSQLIDEDNLEIMAKNDESDRENIMFGFILKQIVGNSADSNNLITKTDYNSQDTKKTIRYFDLTNAKYEPIVEDSKLTIDGFEFDLGDEQLDADGVANKILMQDTEGNDNFTNFDVSYDSESKLLKFESDSFGQATTELIIGTENELTFNTQADKFSSTIIEVPTTMISQNLNSDDSNLEYEFDNKISLNIDSQIVDIILSSDVETYGDLTNQVKIQLEQNSIFTSMYSIEMIDGIGNENKLKITKNLPGLHEVILLDENSDSYTTTNEIKSTGMFTVPVELIENSIDKKLRIDSTDIELSTSDDLMSKTDIAEKIADTQFPNVIATANGETVSFTSKLTGENGDFENIVSTISSDSEELDDKYNGRYQSVELNFGDVLEPGFTYNLQITNLDGDQTFLDESDLVTPQNSDDYQTFLDSINTQLDNLQIVDSSINGNIVTVIGENIGDNFEFSLTGASNSAPMVNSVSTTFDINTNSLTCTYDISDAENDILGEHQIKWYIESDLEYDLIEGQTSMNLELTEMDLENQNVLCEVTPKANSGVQDGQAKMSQSILTPYKILKIKNGDLFSVPYGVHSDKMIMDSNVNSVTDNFATYKNGMWNNVETDDLGNPIFEPLYGYKFNSESEDSVMLPIYIDSDYDLTNIKRVVDSDFNLVGLNSYKVETANDYLSSLSNGIFSNSVNSIYDMNGVFVGEYYLNSGQFYDETMNLVTLNPNQAYWITVSGTTDEKKIFYGVSNK